MTIKKGDIVLTSDYREAKVLAVVSGIDATIRYYKLRSNWGFTSWVSHYEIKAIIEARS